MFSAEDSLVSFKIKALKLRFDNYTKAFSFISVKIDYTSMSNEKYVVALEDISGAKNSLK